jgi:YVTN family beta-propeller protein
MPKRPAARALLVTAALILAIDAGGSSAARGRLVARLSLPSEGVTAGRTATATVTVTRGGRPAGGLRPRVRFAAGTNVVVAAARPSGAVGRYAARFRLPLGGAWTYRITVGKVPAGSGRLVAAVESRLPGADAFAICADAGSFWPTMTLAVDFGSVWVACKELGRLMRLDAATLRTTKVFTLGRSGLIAVAAGLGSVWALDETSGTLDRIDPAANAVTARIALGGGKPYNVWVGAGAVWVCDDGSGEIVRIDPATNRVAARIPVGDGPADLVFDGTTAWVVNHRDLGLVRIDVRTNTARRLATLPADAPERMVLASGRLWITGRGTDLLEVDPATGAVLRTVDIGASGIDVVARGDTIWVPNRDAGTDPRGFPTMEALRRVDARSGVVTATTAASGALDVHGLVADDGGVWLADNTHGVLYRVRG